MSQHNISTGVIINFGQTIKSNAKNLGIILVQGETLYDYTGGTFVTRGSELTL
jgi:hypothetical protein